MGQSWQLNNMSKLFYDHLIEIDELEDLIRAQEVESEEKEELYHLVDEMIHHRVLGCILDHLPKEHHEEFLTRFHSAPNDMRIIVFIQIKTPREIDMEEKIREEIQKLKKELLEELST